MRHTHEHTRKKLPRGSEVRPHSRDDVSEAEVLLALQIPRAMRHVAADEERPAGEQVVQVVSVRNP